MGGGGGGGNRVFPRLAKKASAHLMPRSSKINSRSEPAPPWLPTLCLTPVTVRQFMKGKKVLPIVCLLSIKNKTRLKQHTQKLVATAKMLLKTFHNYAYVPCTYRLHKYMYAHAKASSAHPHTATHRWVTIIGCVF